MTCKNRAKPLKKKSKTRQKSTKTSIKRKKRGAQPARRPKIQAKPKTQPARQPKARPKIQAKPKAAPQDLNALRKTWYAKLKESGFNDLEVYTYKDGMNGLLKSTKASRTLTEYAKTKDLREVYFRRLTNFVTHNPNWARDKTANMIAQLYIQGISYRKMLPKLESANCKTNIWNISHVVTRLEQAAKVWDRTHPEGRDFQADLELNVKLIS
jgi:hypothetical protein